MPTPARARRLAGSARSTPPKSGAARPQGGVLTPGEPSRVARVPRRHSARSSSWQRRVPYVAVYTVDRFCPFDLSAFDVSPCFSTRGSFVGVALSGRPCPQPRRRRASGAVQPPAWRPQRRAPLRTGAGRPGGSHATTPPPLISARAPGPRTRPSTLAELGKQNVCCGPFARRVGADGRGEEPEELRALFEGEFVDLIGGDQLDLGSLGKTASRHAGVTSRHAVVRGRR